MEWSIVVFINFLFIKIKNPIFTFQLLNNDKKFGLLFIHFLTSWCLQIWIYYYYYMTIAHSIIFSSVIN